MVVKSQQQVTFDLGLPHGRRRLGEKLREERRREAEMKKEGMKTEHGVELKHLYIFSM